MSTQTNNPLHGITLQKIVETLQERYGWEGLASRIPVRCFQHDPSLKSSLAFLRRTPWAREKVEQLYLQTLKPAKTATSNSAGKAPTVLFGNKK